MKRRKFLKTSGGDRPGTIPQSNPDTSQPRQTRAILFSDGSDHHCGRDQMFRTYPNLFRNGIFKTIPRRTSQCLLITS